MSTNDDIDRWVEKLRRKAPSMPDHKDEVSLIKTFLVKRQEKLAPADAHQFERLRFRLEREGLLQKSRWHATRPALYALAATLAVIAVSVSLLVPPSEKLQMPSTDDTVTIRSGGALQILRVEDPAGLSLDIAQILGDAGITSQRSVKPDGTILIEARVPEETRARLHNRFKGIGVEIPMNGRLRLLLAKAKE